jgi:beta-glucosidase
MKIIIVICLLSCLLIGCKDKAGKNQPFRNHNLPTDERVELLLGQLTISEKINLLCAGADSIPRLGIPAYNWWNECLHGVARAGQATVFPKPINLGCTWDTALVKQISTAISDEGRAKYHQTLTEKGYTERYEGITFFSPTLNISRDPRWGRNDETFSEDPLLTSSMGVSFIQGLQGDHPKYLKTVATAKHFVANNEEDRRHAGSSNVDEKSLREYYFPAFKKAVIEGKTTSVMGAYNALNDVPCCANSFLLTTILREEWGFDGVVMSDGSAVEKIFTHHEYANSEAEGAAKALLAGCDMSLRDEYRSTLQQALEQKFITEEDIDISLKRVLKLRFRLGMFDDPEIVPYANIPYSIVECNEHQQLALEAAQKSILLLKNDDILPIQKNKKQKIALIGKAAKEIYFGDYSGESIHGKSLFDGLSDKIEGTNIELLYATEQDLIKPIDAEFFQREEQYEYEGRNGLMAEIFENSNLEGIPAFIRPVDNIDVYWRHLAPEGITNMDNFSIRWKGHLIPPKTGIYNFYLTSDDGIRLYIDGKLVVDAWNQSDVNIKQSFEVSELRKHDFVFEYCERGSMAGVSLSWELPKKSNQSSISQVVKDADVAVVFFRDTGGNEGKDRTTLKIQEEQLQLLKEVVSVNPNTVAIISSTTPLILNWVNDNIPAIIYSWIPGQAEGMALADILLGDANPSAKSSVTFFANEDELPPIDDYHMQNGRSYQFFKGEVLYPFGHGLSYTTFKYSDLKVTKLESEEKIILQFELKNTGAFAGDEVSQCYLIHPDSELKKLIGFTRVSLKPDESKTIHIAVDKSQLAIWEKLKWSVKNGIYKLQVGSSSEEIQLKKDLEVPIR